MADDRKRLISEIVALLVVVALVVAFMSRRRTAPVGADQRLMMGTIVSVTVFEPDRGTESAVEAAFDEIGRIEAITTRYSDNSEISLLNTRAEDGVEFETGREVSWIVGRSLEIAEASGGAFDITVAPLVDLWALADTTFVLPDPDDVASALEHVGSGKVAVGSSGGTVRIQPGSAIDLDGVAKGYAVDRAIAVLAELDVESAIVDAGGVVGFLGSPAGDRGWRVGVKDPRSDGLIGVLTVSGGSVATSGDYQRFATVDGERYHHVLDPSTGYPARGVISATVTAGTALDADALATAVFVMGPEEGLGFIESLPGVEAVIITGDEAVEDIIVSSGLADRFEESRR